MFLYLLFLIGASPLYSCHQLTRPENFVQLLDKKQEEASAYINDVAQGCRNNNDPLYCQYKVEFDAADKKVDHTLRTLRNLPRQFPQLLCSEQTKQEIYHMLRIDEKAPYKPLLINRPGYGFNAGALAKLAIFLDENFFKANKDKFLALFTFIYTHEYSHIVKYQPDENTLRNIQFTELYLQKVREVPIYSHQRPILAQFIESIHNALKILNYCYEWGADERAASLLPTESIFAGIHYYRSCNEADCFTHPGSNVRADFIEQRIVKKT